MDTVILSFVSGKGGTGNTTTAVLTGRALASLGKKVLYVELKTSLRTADIVASMARQVVFDVSDVLRGVCSLEKAALQNHQQEGFWVLCAPYEDGFWSKRSLNKMLAECRGRYDFVLLDTSGGLDEGFALATEAASRAVLVMTPDPATLRIGQLMARQPELEHKPVRMILNRVNPERALARGVMKDLDEAIDMAEVQLLGVVPDSAAIQIATTGSRPLGRQTPENKIYQAIARRILGEDVPLLCQ